ncbi:site-2 protease family protein [Candidatus Woesearchaeota archaeon]|nr:site-2 protease family protein [Candidatus Woesearchaeota archaeon]
MNGLRILRIHGIDVYLHYSWWLIFALLAYNLALDFFPASYPGLSSAMYWLMGALAAVLLFVSVLLHELTHSLVARARKIRVESITLFFFGGVASIPSEDVKPATEFWMALAGPLFSLALAGALFFVHQLALPVLLKAVTAYLWRINLVLGIFNLVPGFPLDGGRVFRALLMFHYKSIRKATMIASKVGRFFGGMLVFLGFLSVFGGNFSGLWFVFLGSFLWMTAKGSYEQVVIKDVLGRIPVLKLMKKSHSLAPDDTLDDAISLYKQSDQDGFVVESKGKFVGMVDVARIGRVGINVVVTSVMIPANEIEALNNNESAYDALRKLEMQRLSVLPVVVKGTVKGVVTRNTVSHHLTLGMKFGQYL